MQMPHTTLVRQTLIGSKDHPTQPTRVFCCQVVPYYGYARADRKSQGRESIAAKLTANIITEAGASRVLAMDLHSGQCVGYFDIPVGRRPLLLCTLILNSCKLMHRNCPWGCILILC